MLLIRPFIYPSTHSLASDTKSYRVTGEQTDHQTDRQTDRDLKVDTRVMLIIKNVYWYVRRWRRLLRQKKAPLLLQAKSHWL